MPSRILWRIGCWTGYPPRNATGRCWHLIPLITFVLSAGTLGIIASLVIYLLFKDRGPFVRAHAATSLNFQIMAFLGLGISVILMFLLVGFITYPAICVVAIVVHAIGAARPAAVSGTRRRSRPR